MEKLQQISLSVMALTIVGMLIHRFIAPLPDGVFYLDGALMMVSLFMTVFSTVRISTNK